MGVPADKFQLAVQALSALDRSPSMESYLERMAAARNKVLAGFMELIGATPENADQYSLVYQAGADWPEIWHNGKKVGEMFCRMGDAGRVTVTFECRQYEETTADWSSHGSPRRDIEQSIEKAFTERGRI